MSSCQRVLLLVTALVTIILVVEEVHAQQDCSTATVVCPDGSCGPCVLGQCPLSYQTCTQNTVCCPGIMTTTVATTTTLATTTTPTTTTTTPTTTTVTTTTTTTTTTPTTTTTTPTTTTTTATTATTPTTTTAAATTPGTTAAPCLDKATNCAQLVSYCNNPDYKQLLEQNCPLTCHFCSLATCVDDPAANCAQLQAWCYNMDYEPLLEQHCAATCAYCSTGSSPAPSGTTSGSTCADDPTTNCAQLKSECTNSAYCLLMKQYCPATCGFCASPPSC